LRAGTQLADLAAPLEPQGERVLAVLQVQWSSFRTPRT